MKILLIFFISLSAHASLLDKVAGVINDEVYTTSELNRVMATLPIRREIAPFIYTKNKISQTEVLKILQNQFIIRDKLAEQGYVISDDKVDANIEDTEKRLRLTREQLLKFLSENNISFKEYYELMRTAMEYSVFLRNIISPLVVVTEQEVKNEFYNQSKDKKTLSFRYKVVDFTLPKENLSQSEINYLPNILNEYRRTGSLPNKYKNLSTNDLGAVLGDELPSDLNELLKSTAEKEFSRPYIKSGIIHLFFLDSKDLVASEDFNREKDQIYRAIFEKRSKDLVSNWLQRQSLNYYILENL